MGAWKRAATGSLKSCEPSPIRSRVEGYAASAWPMRGVSRTPCGDTGGWKIGFTGDLTWCSGKTPAPFAKGMHQPS